MYRRVKAARHAANRGVDVFDVHSFTESGGGSRLYSAVVADVLLWQDFNYGDEVLLRDDHVDGLPWVCAVLTRSGSVSLEIRFGIADNSVWYPDTPEAPVPLLVATQATQEEFEKDGAVTRVETLERLVVTCGTVMGSAQISSALRRAERRWIDLLGDAVTITCVAATLNDRTDDIGQVREPAPLRLCPVETEACILALSDGWWEAWLCDLQHAGIVRGKIDVQRYLENVVDTLSCDPLAVYAVQSGNGWIVARDVALAMTQTEPSNPLNP